MKLILKALSQYGIREVNGNKDHPQILAYFESLGFDGSKLQEETAWCSAYVNWVAKECGYPYSGKLNARSWLTIGQATETPDIGDIVVLWRESPESWKGHVGFYISQNQQYIYLLGGNQKNMVCIQPYDKKRVLDYRKLIKNG